jgi:hypothetical protein
MLSILVFISSSDLSLFSTLKLLVAVIEELRIEPESELEPDLVLSKISIISKSEFKPTEISIRVLRVVLVSLLVYR